MSKVLQPCPFCGSNDLSMDFNLVVCQKCGCEGPLVLDHDDHTIPTDVEVADAWNRRRVDGLRNWLRVSRDLSMSVGGTAEARAYQNTLRQLEKLLDQRLGL